MFRLRVRQLAMLLFGSLKMDRDKLAVEKAEIQRQFVLVSEIAFDKRITLNYGWLNRKLFEGFVDVFLNCRFVNCWKLLCSKFL